MRKYVSERKVTEKYINSISKFGYKDYKPNKTILKVIILLRLFLYGYSQRLIFKQYKKTLFNISRSHPKKSSYK